MTVYSKTNLGRLVAFEKAPSIAPVLRDLLRRVDGKTPYQDLISEPSDVALFEELELRRLVQIAPQQWRNSSGISQFSNSAVTDDTCNEKKAVPHLSLVAKPDHTHHNAKMAAVKALMCSFVQEQLPQHADTTLTEIDGLSTEAQLLCMLSGYMNLVDSTGKAGQQHVQKLLLTLAGNE